MRCLREALPRLQKTLWNGGAEQGRSYVGVTAPGELLNWALPCILLCCAGCCSA